MESSHCEVESHRTNTGSDRGGLDPQDGASEAHAIAGHGELVVGPATLGADRDRAVADRRFAPSRLGGDGADEEVARGHRTVDDGQPHCAALVESF
jgi:hypothetical protein